LLSRAMPRRLVRGPGQRQLRPQPAVHGHHLDGGGQSARGDSAVAPERRRGALRPVAPVITVLESCRFNRPHRG
jgi:hypothetical protein